MVDVVGRLRVQIADRVVADGRQVQHRVEADEVLDLDVAHVLADRLDLGRRLAERARGEQIEVQPDHLVAGLLEQGGHHGADVAVVAGDEYAHMGSPGIRAELFRADAHRNNGRAAVLAAASELGRSQHEHPVLVPVVVLARCRERAPAAARER